ncbi:MAG: hypothetical protein ABJH52_13115 [Henriciella sp.]
MSDPLLMKIDHPMIGDHAASHALAETVRGPKWPVWVRLLIMFGISAGLWTLIMYGVGTLFF